MPFDVRTVILTGTFLTLVQALILALVSTRVPASQRVPVRMWSHALWLLSVFWLLLALRGRIPDLLSIAVANIGLILALAELARALGLFLDRTTPPWLRSLPLLLMLLAVLLFQSVWLDYPRFVLLGSAAAILAMGLTWWPTRASWQRGGELGQRIAGGVFLLGAGLLLLRLLSLFTASVPSSDPFSGTPQQVLPFLYLALAPLAASLGFLLMCSERSQDDLRRLATIDALTGAFSRHALIVHAARALSEARRHGRPLSLLLIDVDHFKRVNDEYGHAAGDLVLRSLAEKVAAQLRAEDALGRIGGEEFVAVLPDTAEMPGGLVAERIRRVLASEHAVSKGMEIPITASIGVAEALLEDEPIEDLIKRADQAMYAAKRAGRDRTILASHLALPPI